VITKTIEKFDEGKALQFPVDGIFGCEDEAKTLSDKIVTARKEHTCHNCGAPVLPGERHRAISQVYDGEFGTFRFCSECCLAMSDDVNDGTADNLTNRIAFHPGHQDHESDYGTKFVVVKPGPAFLRDGGEWSSRLDRAERFYSSEDAAKAAEGVAGASVKLFGDVQ
jgi:hypothetical protein